MRVRVFVAVLLVVAVLGGSPASPAQAQNCQFVLGFATLHNLIPQIVGNCLTDEQHGANGDGLQPTTNGLLVWRKADNFTAFTDGFRTWVNGPFGLQMRLNSQRFFWEQNPTNLPIIPTPVAGQSCHTAGLALSVGRIDAGAGNFEGPFFFTNKLSVPCTMFGFPGAQMLDAQNNPLPTRVVRNGPHVNNQPGPTLVTLPPSGTASFLMHWEDVPVGNETSCPTSSQLAVTPPDEFDPLIIPIAITACGGGELDVSAIQPAM